MFDPARLMFIDETCTNTALVRLRGRAPRGERLLGYAPHEPWKTITVVGGLRQRGTTAPFCARRSHERADVSRVCDAMPCPDPQARRDRADGPSAGKVVGVAEATEAARAKLIYLPKYSPDLNPIERAFTNKAHLR